jgi:hypothetical protein
MTGPRWRLCEKLRLTLGIRWSATKADQIARRAFVTGPRCLSDETVVAEEGCLSLPRVAMDVERPLHARLGGFDVAGEPLKIEASGLEARVLQHEIDHLDGVLILDRAPRAQRKAALRALREGGSYTPAGEEGEAQDAAEHREPRTDA